MTTQHYQLWQLKSQIHAKEQMGQTQDGTVGERKKTGEALCLK